MKTIKTEFQAFLEKAEHRRLYEQEKLLLDTAELLTEVMDAKKVSRAELARKLGKSRSFVTQVLRGNHNMTLRTLADIFFTLDYQVSLQTLPVSEETESRSKDEWLDAWVPQGQRYKSIGAAVLLVRGSYPFTFEVSARASARGEDVEHPCGPVAA
jgi:transcriptional regulator with XRE-family HTH domain